MRKVCFLVLCFILLGAQLNAAPLTPLPLDFPHSPSNIDFNGPEPISCKSCHLVYGSTENYFPLFGDLTGSLDSTVTNSLCQSCHNDVLAPAYPTHSSEALGTDCNDADADPNNNCPNPGGYGQWSVECKTCHWVHEQPQLRTYGAESYLAAGVSTAISSEQVVGEPPRVNGLLTVSGAGWTPDEFQNLILLPNLAEDHIGYKIIGNTSDTIKVSGEMTGAVAGDEFAVIYGKVIKSEIDLSEIRINYPSGYVKSGVKKVRFFGYINSAPDAVKANAYAAGDSVYDGICEVCHTRTAYHRNNNGPVSPDDGWYGDAQKPNHTHNIGIQCTKCHKHSNAFKGMGAGAHEVHVSSGFGPNIGCTSGDYGCHGAAEIPLFIDGADFANTTSCDFCHSADGVSTIKANGPVDGYWNKPCAAKDEQGCWSNVEGEVGFCGSCHDSTPGNAALDGTLGDAPNVMGDGATFGFSITGHGLQSGNYARLAFQPPTEAGNPAANQACSSCHDRSSQHFGSSNSRLRQGYENDQNNTNCNQCHFSGKVAVSPPYLYKFDDPADYETSPHGVLLCTACHDVHGRYDDNGTMAPTGPGMIVNTDVRTLCFACHNKDHTIDPPGSPICLTCHPDGVLVNAPLYPPPSPLPHDELNGTEPCSNCHNPHNPPHGKGGSGIGCVECHGHDAGTVYDPDMTAPWTPNAGGLASQGRGSSQSHSTHTELDADDAKGPAIYCDGCHDIANFPYFKSGFDSNGDNHITLDETDVCDPCHSPGGTYDGLNDLAVGAKINWKTGIYATFDTLAAGKQKWCATCHDESPATIMAVPAPNIVGDESAAFDYGVGYGFYKTGHGLPSTKTYPSSGGLVSGAGALCSDCHDYSLKHIDGAARTYNNTAATGAADDYRNGYRLKMIGGLQPMTVPRTVCFSAKVLPEDFRLCFSCHNSAPFTDVNSLASNYRDDNASPGNRNGHYLHLGFVCGTSWKLFASDWKEHPYDSGPTCITCHNVHGSTRLAMVRDGKLVNKEPGLKVAYYNQDVSYGCNSLPNPANVTLPDSTAGIFDGDIYLTICGSACHPGCNGSVGHNKMYTRLPYDETPPYIANVYGKIGSSSLGVVFSERVYSDLGASGDLLYSDFAFFDSDNNRTISTVYHTAGDKWAQVYLNSTLDAVNDIGFDSLAPASAAAIYDASGNAMAATPATVLNDGFPPHLTSQSPPNGSTSVMFNSNISFTLSDNESGVDWKSLWVQLKGNQGYSQTYSYAASAISKTGDPAAYDVTITPSVVFGPNETITVTVGISTAYVKDLTGNVMPATSWSFTSVPDTFAPVATNLNPSNGAVGVPVNGNLTFTLSDSGLGVDWSSFEIQLTGDLGYNQIYTDQNTTAVSKTGTPASYDVTVNPTVDFNYGETIVADVYALDLAGNPVSNLPLATWQFTVESLETVPPVVSAQNPYNGQIDVLRGADISFTISDVGLGVDWSTFQIQLTGSNGYLKTYPGTHPAVSKTGTPASYDVTVNPDIIFSYSETIIATVSVADIAGNPMNPVSWSFNTAGAGSPSQTITLHPSGLVGFAGGFLTEPDLSLWADILDSNDGDVSFAQCGAIGSPTFKVDMDDPSVLEGATIESITFYALARYTAYLSSDPDWKINETPSTGEVNIGYQTGTTPVWNGAVATDGSDVYNLISSQSYTLDSDSGPLDLNDILNLKIMVEKSTFSLMRLRVTEVYAEVVFTP